MQPWSQPLLWKTTTATGDSHWSNVVFLMGFEGANNSTGAPGFTDESSHAHGTGTNAFDAIISTTTAAAGSSALSMVNGATGKDAVTWPGSADWNFGSSPFTVEFFISIQSSAGISGSGAQPIFQGPNNNWQIFYSGTLLTFTCTNGTSPVTLQDTVNVIGNTGWFYVCVDFDGSKYRLYDNYNTGLGLAPLPNANMIASSTSVITITNDVIDTVQFGSTGVTVGLHSFFGRIDEFRITKGVARYASDSGFTVPAVPFPRHA